MVKMLAVGWVLGSDSFFCLHDENQNVNFNRVGSDPLEHPHKGRSV